MVKDALEFGGADGVDGGEMENAALEVLGEGGVSLAVLGLWALAEGVGEDGFELVVSGAGEVGLFVDEVEEGDVEAAVFFVGVGLKTGCVTNHFSSNLIFRDAISMDDGKVGVLIKSAAVTSQ